MVAASIQPKSGTPSASTNSGTTTTTASDAATAAAVSVVADSSPALDRLLQLDVEVVLAGERLGARVDQLDDLLVDVRADDLVALGGELNRERKADLAERDYTDFHRVTFLFNRDQHGAQPRARDRTSGWHSGPV